MAMVSLESGPSVNISDVPQTLAVGTALVTPGAVCAIHFEDTVPDADLVAEFKKLIGVLSELQAAFEAAGD